MPRPADPGLPAPLIQRLEQLLLAAPQRQWHSASCSYGLVLDVLQLAEQGLRQGGLHTSAGQLEALAREFRRQRRSGALIGEPVAERPRQIEQLPQRRSGQRQRKLPRLRQS